MSDPTRPLGEQNLADLAGSAVYGDRWSAVKASMRARRAEAARAARRQARIDRTVSVAANVYAVIVEVLVLAILVGLAVDLWRWAL